MTPLESAQAAFIEAKIALGDHEVFDQYGARWCFTQRPGGTSSCWQIDADEATLTPTIEMILDTARVRKSALDFLIFPSASPANLAKVLRRDWRMMGPMYLEGMTCDLASADLTSNNPVAFELHDWDTAWQEQPLCWWASKAQKPDWWQIHKELHSSVGLKVFVADFDGRPSASACLFCHEGVGLITSVITATESRGRGLGSAVVQACMASASQQGCQWAGLLGHKRSLPFYKKLGFKTGSIFTQLYYSKVKAENQPLFSSSLP